MLRPSTNAGRLEVCVAGRDQEGVPQARARVPPDKNPGDAAAEERFKEVQTAYDVLADEDKRKQYDRFGATNGRPGPQNVNVDFGDFDLGDLLGGIFGGLGGRAGGTRAQRQRCAAATSRRSCTSRSRTRSPAPRRGACRADDGMPRVRWHGRAARHRAGHLPGVQRPRREGGEQGLFALSQPCPRCRATAP